MDFPACLGPVRVIVGFVENALSRFSAIFLLIKSIVMPFWTIFKLHFNIVYDQRYAGARIRNLVKSQLQPFGRYYDE